MLSDPQAEMPVQADGSATEGAKLEMKSRVHEFLQSKPGRVKQLDWKRPLAPNAEHMRAFDHAIQAGTMGALQLSDFKASQVPRCLQPDEKRYFVSADQLPRHLAADIGCLTRSCIINKTTSDRTLEVQWTSDRRVLQDVSDQGSIGHPARYYLFQAGLLRGHCWFDPPHRRFNNWQGDVKRTGAQAMRLETSLVMSIRKGPWSGASTYWKLHKTAQQYFDTFDHHEELFGLLYEDIVVDLNEGRVPGGRGTDAHMASTWEACKQCPFFIREESRLREVDGSSGRTRLRSWRLGTPSSCWCCLCTA